MFFYDFLSYRTTHYKVRTDISKKGQQMINLGHMFQTKDHTVQKLKQIFPNMGPQKIKLEQIFPNIGPQMINTGQIIPISTTDDKFRTDFSKEGPEMIK